ncbi:MAG TPA: hypothetical protein VHW44_10755 [Pseudonocardiaceae bacterium]|jgi:hypothetical protein|nr:hypothetical protein [Pseudonocardiaceae bacterium]
MTDNDPRAKYRTLPAHIDAGQWVEEQPAEALPGSVRAAADDAQMRDDRRMIELTGGF